MMELSDQKLFYYSLIALYLISPLTYIPLRFLQAPYGKHNRSGWGPTISPPVAWVLMESPSLILPLLVLPFGRHSKDPKALILLAPYITHYIHRTCIYPLKIHNNQRKDKPEERGFPLSIAMMGFGFNVLNAYLQVRWVSHYKEDYGDGGDGGWSWVRYGGGLVVFGLGMWLNIWADRVLVGLKRVGGGRGYKVPRGGWFEMVSCPNYLGEIVEWIGWSVMTWSWVGLGFLIYTCANLVPRARAHHKWYLEKFGEDYPKNRKAVIPYLY
ncbi:hypothetical protein K2173_019599 [Erythroxylum novogranatense]|uniref:Steroid 5-alpha-reductase DET2 n=1 Tax=Erythroxylum novogranatense TaxID=1862640 RepID=A0AAV8UEI3_9ROSI|nr:hypothetical protein K2173_019599 [Erythroxylum novogranatense]